MELLDELNHEGKTVIISTHNVELAYPWADRAILLLDGRILYEDVPDVAFGNSDHVRKAHLSIPTLLELSQELGRRGLAQPERKPRSVLDMVDIIENLINRSCENTKPGTISVYNVDEEYRYSSCHLDFNKTESGNRCYGYPGQTTCKGGKTRS